MPLMICNINPFRGRKIYYNILLDYCAGLNQTYNELLKLYNEVIINLEEIKFC